MALSQSLQARLLQADRSSMMTPLARDGRHQPQNKLFTLPRNF